MAIGIETRERNQSIELCRLVAAIAVVFLHVPLPDPIGGWIGCMARFAVPFFFLVSGYFSFARDSAWAKRRLWQVLKLNVYATLPFLLWKYLGFYRGSSLLDFLRWEVFPKNAFMDWLLRHINPAAGHLWFLAALVPCYGSLWLYGKLREGEERNNHPLYLTGFFLMVIYFLFSTILPINGTAVPYMTYRNGWFLGLPLFLLGMFLHEHEETIKEKFHLTTRNLGLLILAGILLSLLQYRAYGTTEVFLGTIPEVIGLLLLLTSHPTLPGKLLKKAAAHLGRISTVLYIIHILILEVYETCILPIASLPAREPWLAPFLIAGISLVIAILWDWLLFRIKTK